MWNADASFCTTESCSVAVSYATVAASFLISSQRVTHLFIDLKSGLFTHLQTWFVFKTQENCHRCM